MAGISAAIWARRIGLSLAWFEADDGLGGQLRRVASPIPDWPGAPAADGAALLRSLRRHLDELGLRPSLGVRVTGVTGGQVRLAGGDAVTCGAAIVCTGLQRRRLGLPGEDRLAGISFSASRDRRRAAGSSVVVVGGGDGGVENAVLLREVGCDVTLVHRGRALRARPDLVDRLGGTTLLLEREVCELRPDGDRLRAVVLDDGSVLEAQWLFVKVGFAPVTGFLRDSGVELDGAGYIVVDTSQRTSSSRVFAAGDVCTPRDPALTVAAGQATVAVKSARELLAAEA